MAYATIAGNKEMGSRIKNQRKALGLTSTCGDKNLVQI